jgi:hypothetical protein
MVISICLKEDLGKGLSAIDNLSSQGYNTSLLDIKNVQQLQSFVAIGFKN